MASNTRQSLELLEDANIRSDFWETWEGIVPQQWVNRITGAVLPSDKSKEEYSFLNGAPNLAPSTGKMRLAGLSANKLEIENVAFDAGLGIPLPQWRRDRTGILRRKVFFELAEKSKNHWAKLLSTLIENGFSTAGPVDAKNFFATDHFAGAYTAQKNLLTVSEYPSLAFVSLTNPTTAEMTNAIFSIISHFFALLDDTGDPRNEGAKDFVVMVPVKWMRQAMGAATLRLVSDGSKTIDNPLLESGFNVEVVPNPRLTAANNYIYAFRTADDGMFSPFVRQSETLNGAEIDFTWLGEKSEYAITNKQVAAQIEASRATGYGDWWRAVAGTCSQV